MPSLFVFNPDTDYALASNRRYYTPPANVIAIRQNLGLLPALYASPGDAILLLDSPQECIDSLEYYQECVNKRIRVLTIDKACSEKDRYRRFKPRPWGWNKNIRQLLYDCIGDMPGMPDDSELDSLRDLSHRRTTITMMSEMKDIIDGEISLPEEINDVDKAMAAYEMDRNRFFKAPWSSSGRGILLADDLEPKHVEPWIRGIIRKQGSVMMEKAYDKTLDFAFEWICDDSEPSFMGFSLFETSRRGKYHGNLRCSQSEMRCIIQDKCKISIDRIIESQQASIKKIISPYYNGMLGIDMLCTSSGNVNPCIEINLRYTMGMIDLIRI